MGVQGNRPTQASNLLFLVLVGALAGFQSGFLEKWFFKSSEFSAFWHSVGVFLLAFIISIIEVCIIYAVFKVIMYFVNR